jgi:Tol biopolymer transport system component
MPKSRLILIFVCAFYFNLFSQALAEMPNSTVPGIAPLASAKILSEVAPNGGWSPAISPDGRKIAFLSSTLHTPADLWIMNIDGSEARRLTTRGVQAFRWSEDSRSIRFTSVRKGFEEVLTIDASGAGREERIPGLPPGASIPGFSPDGSLFAITVPGEQNARDLWIGTADGERLEAVTEKIGIRNVFWHSDSRKIYYEAGSKNYGVGIWELDLGTMESRSLLSKYIGTPVYSSQAGLVAYPYPVNPGEFQVHTMTLAGTAVGSHSAPRLAGRGLVWDETGQGVYYLGQDIETIPAERAEVKESRPAGIINRLKGLFSGRQKATGVTAEEQQKERVLKETPPFHRQEESSFRRVGVTSLWHLDFASGVEQRISPPDLHTVDFALAPDGRSMVLAGVLKESHTAELFALDPGSGILNRLARSKPSAWLATPSLDSSQIAFFANDSGIDTLKIVSLQGGEELAAYPGVIQEGDTRLFWLPQSDGLLIFSGRGLLAFNSEGPIDFPGRNDHRTLLGADVSIQADKVLLNSIPKFGETPGLYMLEAVDNKFVQTDLRNAPADEYAADLYLQPCWSLDGRKIAFTDRIDVWTMNGDGTGRRWLTTYAERNGNGKERPALASYPAWSVRGDMLAYTLTIFEEKGLVRQLWVMKADGSEPKMLHSQPVDSQFLVYLPEYTHLPFFDFDDQRIIFTASEEGVPNIFAVSIQDGALRRLTETGAIFPAMLPEEGVIIYTSLARNIEELMVMNNDGSGKRLLLTGESTALGGMTGMAKNE